MGIYEPNYIQKEFGMNIEPDKELAKKIINSLLTKNMLKFSNRQKLEHQIVFGQMNREEWRLLAENELLKMKESKNG